jgi:uncharacterized protein (TIGR00269 family)
MKCRKCEEKAAINMRQHKLALCDSHFLEWIPAQTERSIERYHMFHRDNRILVAVSGGKDSLALWDILNRLGYSADGLYIGLGIDEGINYSHESQRRAEEFADQHNLQLQKVDVEQEEGASIPVAASKTQRGRGKPCSVCGLTRRHIMNRVAMEGEYDILVTGHNLDDEAAVLFGNTLNWSTGYLIRQGPVLEATQSGLVRKAKPLCRIYEREMAAYALLRGIKYMYDECPHSVGAKSIAHKNLLNRLEAQSPGAKLSFYLSFLRAKEEGYFMRTEGFALHACTTCGQPTTAPDTCAYCRTWKQVRERIPKPA